MGPWANSGLGATFSVAIGWKVDIANRREWTQIGGGTALTLAPSSLMLPPIRITSPKPRLNRFFTMLPILLYRQCSGKTAVQMDASVGSKDNLLSFTQSIPRDHGRTVLNLVFQAAEIFSEMEEQVRETEARAQSMCKSAEERVRLAEKRIEVAERARREIVNDAGRKLEEASKALTNAQARIVAAEDQVTALEFRAQSAEANLHEAKQALLQVEDAIRERFLSEKRSSIGPQTASREEALANSGDQSVSPVAMA